MTVSVNREVLGYVVALACETQYRTNDEQRALLAAAERCDKADNTKASGNVDRPSAGWRTVPGESVQEGPHLSVPLLERTRPLSQLERCAAESRLLDPKAGDRHVKPSWERKRA